MLHANATRFPSSPAHRDSALCPHKGTHSLAIGAFLHGQRTKEALSRAVRGSVWHPPPLPTPLRPPLGATWRGGDVSSIGARATCLGWVGMLGYWAASWAACPAQAAIAAAFCCLTVECVGMGSGWAGTRPPAPCNTVPSSIPRAGDTGKQPQHHHILPAPPHARKPWVPPSISPPPQE